MRVSDSVDRWIKDSREIEDNDDFCVIIVGDSSEMIASNSSSVSGNNSSSNNATINNVPGNSSPVPVVGVAGELPVLASEMRDRPYDRRLGNAFHEHGWKCKYIPFDKLSNETPRSELLKVDCVCFNTSAEQKITPGMIALLQGAAPHLVFVKIARGTIETRGYGTGSAMFFDFECREKELKTQVLPLLSEACIKSKLSLLFITA
jgi:hypothetical protein